MGVLDFCPLPFRPLDPPTRWANDRATPPFCRRNKCVSLSPERGRVREKGRTVDAGPEPPARDLCGEEPGETKRAADRRPSPGDRPTAPSSVTVVRMLDQ